MSEILTRNDLGCLECMDALYIFTTTTPKPVYILPMRKGKCVCSVWQTEMGCVEAVAIQPKNHRNTEKLRLVKRIVTASGKIILSNNGRIQDMKDCKRGVCIDFGKPYILLDIFCSHDKTSGHCTLLEIRPRYTETKL